MFNKKQIQGSLSWQCNKKNKTKSDKNNKHYEFSPPEIQPRLLLTLAY